MADTFENLEKVLNSRRLKKRPEENSDSPKVLKERVPIRKMEELAEETNTLLNQQDMLIAEATEGMNGRGLSFGPFILKGDANLLAKKVVTEEQMKKYLGNRFNRKKYDERLNSKYREEMNYYYYVEKNSLDEVNPRDIIKNKDGTIKVKNKEGRVITLSEEKSYEGTLYHQKIYDFKGNFIGIKSHINPSLNRKFKSKDGYELILSKDMKSVIKDEYNRGTFNWDSDNNFEHYSSDVQFYTKYGSGINDKTTKQEREKTGNFINEYWIIVKTEGRELKRYIEKNKITVITPKVLENYKSKVMSNMLNEKDFIRR